MPTDMPSSAPPKHKAQNKYHFQTFSERLALVNIDAVHRIRRRADAEEDSDDYSHFAESVAKWKDLDLSADYVRFRKEVSGMCKNYKMVMHYRSDLLDALKRHLQKQNTLALPALLELLVAICVDLSSDFYLHFSAFFRILVKLLKTSDVEKLEAVFNAISLLFRHMWRFMVKDMEAVLSMYASLLTGEHPQHVSNFAAESVSFLLRKSRQHDLVMKKVLSIALDFPTASEAIGKVIFHVVKSSQHRFHSCLDSVLPACLAVLRPRSPVPETPHDDDDAAFRAVCSAVGLMAEHTTREHGRPVWDIIVKQITNATGDQSDLLLPFAENLFKILTVWCKVRRGARVGGFADVSKVVKMGVDFALRVGSQSNGSFSLALCDLVTAILSGTKTEIKSDEKELLLSDVCSSTIGFDSLLVLWRSLFSAFDFELFARRAFMTFCQKRLSEEEDGGKYETIRLLCDFVCLQQDNPLTADDFASYQPKIFNFAAVPRGAGVKSTGAVLSDTLKQCQDGKIVWCCLVLCQHLQPIPENIHEPITEQLRRILDNCSNESDLALVAMAIQALLVLGRASVLKPLGLSLMSCFEKRPSSRHTLYFASLLLSKHPSLSRLLTDTIRKTLLENVSSHVFSVRLHSLRILHQVTSDDVYEQCIAVDSIPATLHDYRSRLLQMSKLIKHKDDPSPDAKEAVARFLLSNFTINFSALWPGVVEIVCAQRSNSKHDAFWKILMETLASASTEAERRGWWKVDSNQKALPVIHCGDDCFKAYVEICWTKQTHVANVRFDVSNFRLQLWKALIALQQSEVVESYNRVLVELLFRFVDNEYYQVDLNHSPLQNLSRCALGKGQPAFRRKDAAAMLIAMLKVFAKFNNPNAAASTEKLQLLYHQLLCHINPELQKVALECVLTYKNKNLLLYKDRLFDVLDDSKFRDALLSLNVEEIPSNERNDVIPILLRILYGRMRSKTGPSTAGKAMSSVRRSVVVRFLGHLDADEIMTFVDMILEPFGDVNALLDTTAAVSKSVNVVGRPFDVVPLARQQGILGTVATLVDKLHHKLPLPAYQRVFTMLLSLAASHSSLIEAARLPDESNGVDRRFLPHLKNLRKSVVEAFISVLAALPSPDLLSKDDLEATFRVLVWPDLCKLKNESAGHATVLLKLFQCFCSRREYQVCIVKRNTGSPAEQPCLLAAVVDTLLSPKTSHEIAFFILDCFGMLVNETDEEVGNFVSLSQHFMSAVGELCHDVETGAAVSQKYFGLALLRPYLPDVVLYFLQRFRASKKALSLPPKHLEFLACVSEHVTDDHHGNDVLSSLAEVMLGHVTAVCAKPQSQNSKTLTPALNALCKVTRDVVFFRKLAKLFAKVVGREARQLLVQALDSARSDVTSLTWTCDVVRRLNAWDKRSIEELDFDARLTALQDVAAKLESDEFSDLCRDECRAITPILHCVTHTLLRHCADISLREGASRVLEILISRVKSVANNDDDQRSKVTYRLLVKELLLPAVESGLKSPDEGCRHESISLLSRLVKTFSDEPSLENLSLLSNVTNPDDDFFENVRHIQMHRRARALRRLAKIVAPASVLDKAEAAMETEAATTVIDERPVSHVVASKYLLPIALQLLYGPDLAKHPHVKEASLEVVKACASLMPWPAYRRLLLQSVWAIRNQSSALDVVCAALSVFPFDIRHFADASPSLSEGGKNATVDFPEIQDDDKSNADLVMDVVEQANESPGDDGGSAEIAPSATFGHTDGVQAAVILKDMTGKVLPSLKQILTEKEDDHDQHKLSSAKADIDRCKKKIPLAVAMVSALRNLPASTLRRQVPGVVLKVVGFLRHKLHEVRTAASQTTVKIANLLGPDHLPALLRDLRSGLSKGYQKHVLVSVLHAVLASMAESARVTDFDAALSGLLEVLNEDLFGDTAEEKLVEKLRVKIPEARGRSKAYPAYKILATFVGQGSIASLMEPLKLLLDGNHNHKVKKIAKDVFTEISLGLLDNKGLAASDYLALSYGLLSDKTSLMFPEGSRKKETAASNQIAPRPLSLLLSKTPERYDAKPAVKLTKTNSHLLVEFALQLLHSAFKRQLVSLAEQEHLEMLDPFVEKLLTCLASPHLQTIADACRCMARLFRSDLPSMHDRANQIAKALFKILKDNTKGASNQELASVCFKSLSVLCAVDYGKVMSDAQLRVLLAYAEEDLYSAQRQSHAFDLIKSVLKRGLQCDEVFEVVDKVRKISIQSHSESSRAQARVLYYFFLINYPLTPKKLDDHLEFVLTQLNYEYEDGRASALDMLSSIVTNFPFEFLLRHSGVLFLATSAMLVNDEAPNCRKMSATLIKLLLAKVDEDRRKQLFVFVESW